jgi:hypothetical protein
MYFIKIGSNTAFGKMNRDGLPAKYLFPVLFTRKLRFVITGRSSGLFLVFPLLNPYRKVNGL